MVDETERLVLQMSADVSRLNKGVDQAQRNFDRRLAQMEAQARKSDKNLSRIFDQAGRNMAGSLKASLTAIAPTVAAAFSAQQVIKYADSYTTLQNRLRAAGLEGTNLKRVEDALFEAANRNGLQVDATAQLYQRASLSRQRLGASEAQLLQLVSGTAAALKLQGTSAEAASGPLLQLGQALSGNKVQAEEYNSLIDGLPVVLQAAAKGSARFGGDVAKLTELVKAGKVSSQEFFQALLAGFPAIEAQAGGAATTVSAALQTLDNELGRYIGQTDATLSASSRLAGGIVALSENLDTVVQVVGVLAGVMGTRLVLSMTAGSGAMIANSIAAARLTAFQLGMTASLTGVTRAQLTATAATRAFTAALLANPVGAAIVATAALSAGIIYLGQRLAITGEATRDVTVANAALETATNAYTEASNAAAVATGQEAVVARQAAAEKRALAVAARDAAQAKLSEAAATVALIQAEAGRQLDLERRAPIRGDRPGSVRTIGRAERQRLADAQANADASRASIASANKAIADADAAINRRAPAATPAAAPRAAGGGRAGASGPSPQELAAQREILGLQGQVEILRAQGREADAASYQRQIDILNLTKTFADAGIADAKAAATTQVDAIALGEAAQRGREAGLERTKALLEAASEAQARNAALAEDELGFRAEIARLLGDDAGVRLAERELEIVRRTADLRSKGLSEPDAKDPATRETDQLRGAEIVGGLGSGFKDPLEDKIAFYAEVDRLRQQDVLSEQEAAAAKAQADAMYEEQRLSNTSTFFGTLAELANSSNKELAAIGKAAAIVQATIDGYVAVQKALASAPPPFNYALAAAVGVVAAANVASIAGLKDGGMVTGPGGPRDDKVLRRLSAGEFVVNAQATSQNRALLESINSGSIRLPSIPSAASLPSLGSNSLTYSPSIDARGADLAAVARLEAIMERDRRALPGIINGTREKRARYRLGQNVDA